MGDRVGLLVGVDVDLHGVPVHDDRGDLSVGPSVEDSLMFGGDISTTFVLKDFTPFALFLGFIGVRFNYRIGLLIAIRQYFLQKIDFNSILNNRLLGPRSGLKRALSAIKERLGR